MRTSRKWIDEAVAELDDAALLVAADVAAELTPRSTSRGPLRIEFTLTPDEVEALDEICRGDDLSPAQALTQIVRARLLGRPQFGRADRARLRSCLALLRALEQHVGRAARSASALRQTTDIVDARSEELLDLAVYLRRVGRAIGEAMLGNLQYWRDGAPLTTIAAEAGRTGSPEPVTPALEVVARERARRPRARA
jgi:hypothetical protein